MYGRIKTVINEKKYGFIEGDDNKSYFFHFSNFLEKNNHANFHEDVLVEFQPAANEKGYCAKSCSFVEDKHIGTFKVPETIVVTKHDKVKGWDIIEDPQCGIWHSSDSSIDEALEGLKGKALSLGANAIVRLTYRKEKKSKQSDSGKGTYHYSEHIYLGQIQNVGKKSPVGEYSLADLNGLKDNAKEAIKYIEERRAKRKYGWIVLAIAALLLMLDTGLWPISLLLFFISSGVVSYYNEERWLRFKYS